MKILLLAMPDTVDWLDHIMKIPNLSIVSLAGSVPEHEVHVLDLVVCKERIKEELDRHLASIEPDLVGLSTMTFQFESATRIAKHIRELYPTTKIVVGGYHTTLMYEEISTENDDIPFDFMIRGEGEAVFRELVRELDKDEPGFSEIKGLSYIDGVQWHHNERPGLLDLTTLPLPDRSRRLIDKFHAFNLKIDVCETSRGCPMNCNFCSIRGMYGSSLRKFPVARVIEDLKAIRARGKDGVFFVDDNIMHDAEHLTEICQAILDNGLNDLEYTIQASTVGVTKNADLVALMEKANFRYINLGLESMDEVALKFMRKATSLKINREAIELLKKHNMGINALFIVGFPDDDRESIKRNFKALAALKPDLTYCQFITPYPKTEVREELLAAGMVVNKDDFTKYDGFQCNVRTKHLSRDELWALASRESMKTFPSLLMGGNYFLKRFFFSFLWCELKVIITSLISILMGRPRKWRLDI